MSSTLTSAAFSSVASTSSSETSSTPAGGRRFVFVFLFLGGGALGARRRALEDRPAFRADDRILVEIKELRAARLALAFGSELGFGHDFVSLGLR